MTNFSAGEGRLHAACPWSKWLLTRKHCPKQKGRYPGFHFPSGTFSDPVAAQWHLAEGKFCVIYSCATAHDLHVIPSWLPLFYGGEPLCFSFKVLSHCPIRGLAFLQCDGKINKFLSNGKKNIVCRLANLLS